MKKFFYFDFLKNNTFIFILSAVNSIIRSIVLLFPAVLMQYLVEEGLLKKNWKILIVTSISSFVIIIITNALILLDLYLNKYILLYFSKLRVKLLDSYMKNSIRQISNLSSGDTLHRLLIESERLAVYFYSGISNLIWINTTVITGVILLIIKGGKISVYALIILFLRILIINIITKKKKKLGVAINKTESDFIQIIKENVNNIEFIKTTNSEEQVLQEIKDKINKVYLNNLKIVHLELFVKFIDGIFDSTIRIIFIGLGCLMILKGEILLGTVIALMTVYEWIIPAVEGYISLILDMMKQSGSMKRIYSLLKSEKEDKGDKNIPVSFDIKLKNVQCYNKNHVPLFRPLTISIRSGEKVFLSGQSGIGKTTLFESIAKFNSFYNGEIIIGGIDLKKINEEWIRKNIILVNQNSILFNWTIKENIAFFDIYSDSEIETVLNLLCLDTWINSLPEGLDTVVGEQSKLISGGQAQRLILARALLRKSPVYILDEALSKVDEQTSIKILNNIFKNFSDTIFLTVMHNDLSEYITDRENIIKVNLYKEV